MMILNDNVILSLIKKKVGDFSLYVCFCMLKFYFEGFIRQALCSFDIIIKEGRIR